jgi:hypothetical protein
VSCANIVESSTQSQSASVNAEPRSCIDVASSSTIEHGPRPFMSPRFVGCESKRTLSFVPAWSKNTSSSAGECKPTKVNCGTSALVAWALPPNSVRRVTKVAPLRASETGRAPFGPHVVLHTTEVSECAKGGCLCTSEPKRQRMKDARIGYSGASDEKPIPLMVMVVPPCAPPRVGMMVAR